MKDEVRKVSEEELLIYIVVSTFYKNISERQLENASTILIDKLGVKKSQLRVVECLGSLELPYLINSVCKKFKPDGVVALGCIIEGVQPIFI